MKYQIMPNLTEEDYNELKADIRKVGVKVPVEYDEDGNILDGHNRARVCQELGISDFPKKTIKGLTEHEKRDHIFRMNVQRRHLSPMQRQQLARQRVAESPERSDRSIAKELKVDRSVVKKQREKLEKSGQVVETTISKGADGKTYPRKKKPKPPTSKIMNYQNTDSIEWAKWSWNPFVGCERGCPYCYARDIATRFYGHFKPQFFEDRLEAPLHTNVPTNKLDVPGIRNVFLGSMTDFFGEFIEPEWRERVLEVVKKTQKWNYLILTKNPTGILDHIPLPRNVWVGTTVDVQARVAKAQEVFAGLVDDNAAITFLSCEPLRGRLEFSDMSMFDWVIIGGQSRSSGAPEAQPKWEWVEDLLIQARASGCKIYFKPNLTVRPKEYPQRGIKCL
jgi:protein gp37